MPIQLPKISDFKLRPGVRKRSTYMTFNTPSPYSYLMSEIYDFKNPYVSSRKRMGRVKNACFHWKKPSDCYITSGGVFQYFWLPQLDFFKLDQVRQEAYNSVYLNLDFQDNNNFELIPFLFDLDGTLAMFTKKFWKEISYGSLTWGVLPFVSDLRSLWDSCRDIMGNMEASYSKIIGKRITRQFTYEKYFPATSNGSFNQLFKVKTVLQGTVTDFEMPDDIGSGFLAFIDELGVHPDIKTLYDVIPFSFVLDYFIPVGDALESIHPRGWFNPTFKFNGTVSFDIEIYLTWKKSPYNNDFVICPSPVHVYNREIITDSSLSTRPNVYPEWQMPSWKEAFNTAYLGNSIKSFTKGILNQLKK